MENRASRDRKRVLKTATGVADPVLLMMNAGGASGRVVLLAEDMTYDEAGVMRLRMVRWVRGRAGIKSVMLLKKQLAAGRGQEMTLRRVRGRVMGALRHEGWIAAPDRREYFAIKNLTAEEYQMYRASTARRLMAAGEELMPRKNRVAQAVRVVHRVRMALRKALVPKMAV